MISGVGDPSSSWPAPPPGCGGVLDLVEEDLVTGCEPSAQTGLLAEHGRVRQPRVLGQLGELCRARLAHQDQVRRRRQAQDQHRAEGQTVARSLRCISRTRPRSGAGFRRVSRDHADVRERSSRGSGMATFRCGAGVARHARQSTLTGQPRQRHSTAPIGLNGQGSRPVLPEHQSAPARRLTGENTLMGRHHARFRQCWA